MANNKISIHWNQKVYSFTKIFLFILLGIILCVDIVPLVPTMPWYGLDPSWAYGMNEAVAKGLSIGKDIVFTFGPYAGILTKIYQPELDLLNLFASSILALCYILGLFYFKKTMTLFRLFVYSITFMLLGSIQDSLFCAYPLVVALVCFDLVTNKEFNHELYPPKMLMLLFILFIPFGLLPLIKGTFLLMVGTIAFLSAILFWRNKQKLIAVHCILTPCISLVFFWVCAGQKLFDLPSYFLNLSFIISGYSQAMSMSGPNAEIVIYLGLSGLLLYKIAEKKVPLEAKLYLLLAFSAFLFIMFKAGFVRQDLHVTIALEALMIAAVFYNMGAQTIGFKQAFAYALLAPVVIILLMFAKLTQFPFNQAPYILYANVVGIVNSFNFINVRLLKDGGLTHQFTQRKQMLNELCGSPPLMEGTTDIYSYQQSCLLVSKNTWSPRPVFHSYSAYTSELSKLNEAHLVSEKAPDHIFFRLEPVDYRFPSLDDGASWPLFINNYEIVNTHPEYVLLKKVNNTLPQKIEISHHTELLNERVQLPEGSNLLFAEMDIKLTLLGKIMSLLFKVPMMTIEIELKNGDVYPHRIVPNMAKSGFFISPYVHNVTEYVALFSGGNAAMSVKAMRISSAHPIFWKKHYDLKLSYFVFDAK